MPKSTIPVRQDIATVVGAERQTGLVSIGEAADQLPKVPDFAPALVVAKLKSANEQAERVLAAAQRADISNEEAASVGADFLLSITKRINEVDEERRSITGGFDKLVKGLNALFTLGPTKKLTDAKVLLQGKLLTWQTQERQRLEREAEAERQRIAAEAAAQSEAALEDGDTEGALEILEAAGSIEIEAEKPVIRGAVAALGTTKRKVGKVTNARAFCTWLGTGTPLADDMLKGVEFKQKDLNQLAAAIIKMREASKDPSIGVPGFEASFAESLNARG